MILIGHWSAVSGNQSGIAWRDRKKLSASAGSRTRIDCLEGNHANRYTTDAAILVTLHSNMCTVSHVYTQCMFSVGCTHWKGNTCIMHQLQWPWPPIMTWQKWKIQAEIIAFNCNWVVMFIHHKADSKICVRWSMIICFSISWSHSFGNIETWYQHVIDSSLIIFIYKIIINFMNNSIYNTY